MPEYVVVGSFAVFGNKPGETFAADLSEFDEQRLTVGGHIARVDEADTADDPKEASNG